ncbi:hypothetical protein [Streptomyces qaidamensis]|uniref:hypothetical protein n=1 Tax=Streptomyces qaidamensis TaxID=1783515 RepID=UPI00131C61FC|nr:hypothetical protein [Streptomyces qaidamensis]
MAFDADGRCHVSDHRLGAVLRLDDEGPVVLSDGPGARQGLAVHGEALFTGRSSTAGCGRCR